MIAKDKAGKEYWDRCWEELDLPVALDPNVGGIRNLFNRRLHEEFRSLFGDVSPRDSKLLEVGCGMSIFLPYFAKQFGFKVSGIDYSNIGCEQERAILAAAGVDGDVVECDFFQPPESLLGQFDVVFSFGVAEHFIPTERCLKAFAAFLAPGGLMITIIPNMVGMVGSLQKYANPPVYDIHVPLSREDLAAAHERADLEVSDIRYFMSSGFGVSNVGGVDTATFGGKFRSGLVKAMGRLSAISWLIEDMTVKAPNSRLLSPFIICESRRR